MEDEEGRGREGASYPSSSHKASNLIGKGFLRLHILTDSQLCLIIPTH